RDVVAYAVRPSARRLTLRPSAWHALPAASLPVSLRERLLLWDDEEPVLGGRGMTSSSPRREARWPTYFGCSAANPAGRAEPNTEIQRTLEARMHEDVGSSGGTGTGGAQSAKNGKNSGRLI